MPSYAEVFRVKGYGWLFAAGTLSTWGDYIARVTVGLVVLNRTGSDLATAGTFAVSLLPTVFGRSLLAPLADRFPYKYVLIASHLARAVCVGGLVLAVSLNSSLAVLLTLLFLTEVAGGPAAAASQMVNVDMFDSGPLLMRAYGMGSVAQQLNQAVGLAVGGVVVAFLGSTGGLWFNLATFLVSAAVVARVIAVRPVRGDHSAGVMGFGRDFAAGARYLRRHPVLMALLSLSLLAVWGMSAPEAVALVYAKAGGEEQWGGLLMAAPVLGAVVGVLVVGRWSPQRQNHRIMPMALLMPVPLLLTALSPPPSIAGILWFVCGMLQAFMVPLQTTFALVVPVEMRGRVFGLAGALSVAMTGVAFLVTGWVSLHTTPAAAVSILGVASLGCIVLLAVRWPHDALRGAVETAYAP